MIKLRISRFVICWLLVFAEMQAASEMEVLLGQQHARYPELPSLAALVIVDGEVVDQAAVGVRKMGDSKRVTIDDRYHIGSCTKAFTAVLGAALVEQGLLSWDSRVGERLADFNAGVDFETATLEQMLSNTAGFSGEVPPQIWRRAWAATGSFSQQRSAFAKDVLSGRSEYPNGSAYEYSNVGFSIAGVMMEQATGRSWEDLIREYIFLPLEMKSAGFYGPAALSDVPDQPWGHDSGGRPISPGKGADNPPAIAPAGAIHVSLPDLAKWMQMHLNRETGAVLQKPSSFRSLYQPRLSNYALGWMVVDRPWAGGRALTHMGSNTMYTCIIWIAPEKDFAVVVASNIGSGVAFEPCDQTIGMIIDEFLSATSGD